MFLLYSINFRSSPKLLFVYSVWYIIMFPLKYQRWPWQKKHIKAHFLKKKDKSRVDLNRIQQSSCQLIRQRSLEYSHVRQLINVEKTMLIPQLFETAQNRISELTGRPVDPRQNNMAENNKSVLEVNILDAWERGQIPLFQRWYLCDGIFRFGGEIDWLCAPKTNN